MSLTRVNGSLGNKLTTVVGKATAAPRLGRTQQWQAGQDEASSGLWVAQTTKWWLSEAVDRLVPVQEAPRRHWLVNWTTDMGIGIHALNMQEGEDAVNVGAGAGGWGMLLHITFSGHTACMDGTMGDSEGTLHLRPSNSSPVHWLAFSFGLQAQGCWKG